MTRRRMHTLAVAAVVLLANSGDAFIGTKRSRSRSTSLFYRLDGDSYVSTLEQPTNIGTSVLPRRYLNQPKVESTSELPTWLRTERSQRLGNNMGQLKDAMLASFFTENEALKLMYAIEEASKGDANKAAGAAEFCLILVEHMEMGLNALVAAAFHYSACIENREHCHDGRSILKVWHETPTHRGLAAFGSHAVDICEDAGRLKKLEMVFSSIVNNPDKVRKYPDSKDAESLRKLLLSSTKDWRALAIRSAASLFRLRGLAKASEDGQVKLTSEKVKAAREALFIFAPLASRLGMHRLKNELESAAFQILYRRQHAKVSSLAQQTHTVGGTKMTIEQSMNRIMEDVTKEIRETLENDWVFTNATKHFSVSARVKEPYSMWRKMIRDPSKKHILDVPDAIAFRVVIESNDCVDEEVKRAYDRALCYYVQQVLVKRWAPHEDNPRFKDYIDSPKANGYQSLHYTASTSWMGEDWKMEFQVRSGEMHKVAEFGLASHWDYKEKGKGNQGSRPGSSSGPYFADEDHSSDAYTRRIQEWHWEQTQAAMWDASPATFVPDFLENAVDSRVRADRIQERTARLAPYIQALTKAQSNLAQESVFVFMSSSDSDGKILTLPAGACVLDALKEAKRSSRHANAVWDESTLLHNGGYSSITQQLRNGDVLTVSPAMEAVLR